MTSRRLSCWIPTRQALVTSRLTGIGQRRSSRQADDGPVVEQVDAGGRGIGRQPGHRHHLTADQHHEAGAGRRRRRAARAGPSRDRSRRCRRGESPVAADLLASHPTSACHIVVDGHRPTPLITTSRRWSRRRAGRCGSRGRPAAGHRHHVTQTSTTKPAPAETRTSRPFARSVRAGAAVASHQSPPDLLTSHPTSACHIAVDGHRPTPPITTSRRWSRRRAGRCGRPRGRPAGRASSSRPPTC